MSNVIDCLKKRGLIEALTSDELRSACEKPLSIYVGFDPTADSLHLGNLVGIIALAWFERHGHRPVVVLGGATGRIGDPSGKSAERPLLDDKTLSHNVQCISKIFKTLLKNPLIVNNNDWFSGYFFIDFLRDVGKHFRVNQMLAKEMVRSRLESEEGISFTEFSYQLLQAYDFYYLFSQHGVSLQGGGSDQWGNITAGLELIRKLSGQHAFGLTFPLLTRSDGKKFGKTEEGAVWLSPEKFSPYQFYQYLVRIPDADVAKLMRMLTFMDLEEIASIEAGMQSRDYEPNSAQRRLAEELTRLVHGEEGLATAIQVTKTAAPGSSAALDPELLEQIAADMPHASLSREDVLDQKLVDIAVKAQAASSKGEMVRLIQGGGAYLNNEKIDNPQLVVTSKHLVGNKYLLIGIGKKKKILIKLLPENQ